MTWDARLRFFAASFIGGAVTALFIGAVGWMLHA